ncbi:hypothetical protein EG327_011846 [Venturia inaequalis]|uniref:Uncharacterized protein n=1 Tax=Venturia inaequalis TaxID=5025 RepID=A0A8H3ZA57_VENIN|nr:hypothetical protein EG327_011846 [Venturia inaequalis]
MSPPSLISIPRELRQHIFAYAFEDAKKQDVIFIFSHALVWIKIGVRAEFGEDSESWFINYWERDFLGDNYKPSVTNINNLAGTMIDALPGLADDVTFILGKCLKAFEDDMFERYANWDATWDKIEALKTYPQFLLVLGLDEWLRLNSNESSMEQPPQQAQLVYVPVPYPVFIHVHLPPPPPPPPPAQPNQPQNPPPDQRAQPVLSRPLVFPKRRWVAGKRSSHACLKATGAFRELIRKDNWRSDDIVPKADTWSPAWWKFHCVFWRNRICNGIKASCNLTNEHKLAFYFGIHFFRMVVRVGGVLWNFSREFFGNGAGLRVP